MGIIINYYKDPYSNHGYFWYMLENSLCWTSKSGGGWKIPMKYPYWTTSISWKVGAGFFDRRFSWWGWSSESPAGIVACFPKEAAGGGHIGDGVVKYQVQPADLPSRKWTYPLFLVAGKTWFMWVSTRVDSKCRWFPRCFWVAMCFSCFNEPLVWSDTSVLIAKFATFQNPSAKKTCSSKRTCVKKRWYLGPLRVSSAPKSVWGG